MKILFIQSSPPHGSINAQEGLDAVLMGSAFSECSLLFCAEGVLQLVKDQDTSGLGVKDFSKTFGALRDYGVSNIYCQARSLAEFNLEPSDLILEVTAVDDEQTSELLNSHDRVLTF